MSEKLKRLNDMFAGKRVRISDSVVPTDYSCICKQVIEADERRNVYQLDIEGLGLIYIVPTYITDTSVEGKAAPDFDGQRKIEVYNLTPRVK